MSTPDLPFGLEQELIVDHGLSVGEVTMVLEAGESPDHQLNHLCEMTVLLGQLGSKKQVAKFWHTETKYLDGQAPIEVAQAEGGMSKVKQAAQQKVAVKVAK